MSYIADIEPKGSSPKEEILALTGLRGLAASYVVFFHLLRLGSGARPFVVQHGYIAVDVFLVLSGFIMSLTYTRSADGHRASFSDFMGRRFARIYPLYFALTLSYIAIDLIRGTPVGAEYAWKVVSNLLLIQAWVRQPPIIGTAWSLSAEFLAYLMFPAALVFICRRKTDWRWVLPLCLAVVVLIGAAALPWHYVASSPKIDLLDLHDHMSPAPVIRCLADFSIGMSAHRLTQLRPHSAATLRAPFVGVIIASILVAALFLRHTDIVVVLLSALLIINISADTGPVAAALCWRPIYLLGLWSYALYLVHFRTKSVFDALVMRFHDVPYGTALASSVVIVASLVIAVPLHYFVEAPAQRALRRRSKQTKTAKTNDGTLEPTSPTAS